MFVCQLPLKDSMHSRWEKFSVLTEARVDGGAGSLSVSPGVPSMLPAHFKLGSCYVDSHTTEHCILDLFVSLVSAFSFILLFTLRH